MKSSERRLVCLSLALACAAPAVLAQAQPRKAPGTMTWVVPFAPGAATDTLGRLMAERVARDLGLTIVVENVPGAASAIAATQLARQPADGSRFMIATAATLAINPAIVKKLAYDPERSFTHVGLMATLPFVLVGNAKTAPPTLPDLIKTARTGAGSLNYASAGQGSMHHLAMELFMDRVGGRMVHVPYKGTGAALNDLLGGRIEVMFGTLDAVASHLKSGALRAYGVSSLQRLEALPDAPTLAEQSLPGFEATTWQGLVAPAGMPEDLRNKLNASIRRQLESDVVKRRFREMGIAPFGGTPDEFRTYAAAQARVWRELVQSKGITAE